MTGWGTPLTDVKKAEPSEVSELVRLLVVLDREAGAEFADREAERLGLTIQLAVARERQHGR